jgi:hypothetical protein
MCTRPDIAFAISAINIRHATPTQLHMKQLKRLLCYLDGTRPMGITYGRPSQDNADDIKEFSNSDWAADTTTRRSHSEEVVMLNGGAVSWTSKQQEVVALSTTEAEYVALSRTGQSAVHFRQLMVDVHQRQRGATTVYEDHSPFPRFSVFGPHSTLFFSYNAIIRAELGRPLDALMRCDPLCCFTFCERKQTQHFGHLIATFSLCENYPSLKSIWLIGLAWNAGWGGEGQRMW